MFVCVSGEREDGQSGDGEGAGSHATHSRYAHAASIDSMGRDETPKEC